jgi:hypothetical protein
VGSQGSLFQATNHGEQPTMQARLLARRDDPATSKDAARRVAAHLTESQARALSIIAGYGPGTLLEIATRKCVAAMETEDTMDVTKLYHELARRTVELARDGKVRPTGERRNGARVWEVCT